MLAAGPPPEVAAVAHHAEALACLELDRLDEARAAVAAGLAVARGAGLASRVGDLRATAALLHFHAEQPDRALAELEEALGEAGPDAEGWASLVGQRALVSFRLGRFAEGVADTDAALAALGDEPGSEGARARLRSNRGLALAYRGELSAATEELSAALVLHHRAGNELLAAQVLHNLGFVAAAAGDLPLALRRYDEALVAFVRLDLPLHQLMVDRSALLVAARMVPEARRAAGEAADALDRAGLPAVAAEARLLFAEACLADHDPLAALSAAEGAAAAFARQGREEWVVLARELARRVERALTAEPLDRALSAAASARRLAAAGWREAALSAAVAGADDALAAGRPDLARQCTGAVAPARGGRVLADEPPAVAVLELHVAALAHLARGEVTPARESLERAVALAKKRAGALAEATRRPGHAFPLDRLAVTGRRIALERGDPGEVLEWEDWCRPATSTPSPAGVAAALAARLGDGLVVEFLVHGGELFSVVATHDGCRLLACGPAERVEALCGSLRLAVTRLAYRRASPASLRAMAALARRASAELDARCFAGALAGRAPGSPLVVVPAGQLHDLPLALLPSLRASAVAVAPSAASWCAGEERAGLPPGGPVLLVAGPGVAGGREEVDRLAAECYRDREVVLLTGDRATRAAVVAALGRASVAHLAAHGRFRADNPDMSSLELADGELTAFEMAASEPPACTVLSACDAGRVVPAAGEEVSGTVPSLLGASAGAVVAGAAPLVDAAMVPVSVALHRELAAGCPPSVALAAVRSRFGDPLADEAALAAGEPAALAALAAGSLLCHVAAGRARSATGARLGESRR